MKPEEQIEGIRAALDSKFSTTCAYCDEPFDPASYGRTRTKDHVVPRVVSLPGYPHMARGNIVHACGRCNGLKGGMLPDAMRVMAQAHRDRAALIDQIADRADAIIAERKLLP